MSLINDALKKAQKQRTGEIPTLASMPGVGGESAQRIARRAKPTGFNTLIIRAGIASGIALLLAIGGWLAFGRKAESGKLKAEGSGTVAVQPAVPAQQPATVSQQPAATPTFTLKTEPSVPKTETPPTTVARPELPKPTAPSSKSIAQQPATNNQQPAPVPEPAKPALKLEPKAIQYIEGLKVAGIRASATDAKVLMNDRVYRIGGIVEAELGLKLVEITANSLTFEDERGGRYTRTF
jgi:hypothetical protein